MLRMVPLRVPERTGVQRSPELHQIVLAHLVHSAGRQVPEHEGAVGGADEAGDL